MENHQTQSRQLSTWDLKILETAKKETDPRYFDQFQPITKGKMFAVIALCLLAPFIFFFFVIHFVSRKINRSLGGEATCHCVGEARSNPVETSQRDKIASLRSQ
ncbi:MAG: hypothetical protein HY537_15575 [Deltaproteobacteria bacterium]|nr:hypothetical protein [Deltaproteobacteria bacterium]